MVLALETMSHSEILLTVREAEAVQLGRVDEKRSVLHERPDRELDSKIRFDEQMSRVGAPGHRDDASDALVDPTAPLWIVQGEDLDGGATIDRTENVFRVL
jgi:hypothetical protein